MINLKRGDCLELMGRGRRQYNSWGFTNSKFGLLDKEGENYNENE